MSPTLLLALAICNPAPRGGYRVKKATYEVATLDKTDPQVWVHWPEQREEGETFPMVAYNHGAGGGGIAILGYAELFEQIASYGIIVIATRSCMLGCSDGQG